MISLRKARLLDFARICEDLPKIARLLGVSSGLVREKWGICSGPPEAVPNKYRTSPEAGQQTIYPNCCSILKKNHL